MEALSHEHRKSKGKVTQTGGGVRRGSNNLTILINKVSFIYYPYIAIVRITNHMIVFLIIRFSLTHRRTSLVYMYAQLHIIQCYVLDRYCTLHVYNSLGEVHVFLSLCLILI